MVDWLWKVFLGMGTKDFDKGLEFDAECGMCLLFQFVYSRFSGAGLGERGWGSPHPGSGPGGGALKPKEMTGSAVLQVTAGARLRRGGVQQAGSTLSADLGLISVPFIVLRQ